MANVLKVTTPPATNYNNTLKGSPQVSQNAAVKNPVDLDRVLRQDQKDGQSGFGGQQQLHYESNYNRFLESLRNVLPATTILSELMGADFAGIIENPATSPSMAADLQQLMDLLKIDPEALPGFLKDQITSATGLKSVFFDLLRGMMNESSSIDFKSDVLRFAKRFNDLSSSTRILSEIAKNLEDIGSRIPRADRLTLAQMADTLNLDADKGDTAVNLSLLKNEIMPMLSKYIANSNDFGRVRDLLSQLSLNIARYESGTRDDVLASLRSLSLYSAFRDKIGVLDEQSIPYILDRLLSDKEQLQNPLSDQLANIIDKGLRGQAGYENTVVFEQIARAMLVNQSVYMPLLHTLFPFSHEGQTLISELWIDPDDHGAAADGEAAARVFIRFDIQSLGSFEMVMNFSKERVALQLFCPPEMEPDFSHVRSNLRQIAEQNHLPQSSIYVDRHEGALSLAEVFPKIKEGRNNVNVTI